VATHHQYWYDNHHLPDGVSHPKYAKPDMAALHLKPGELILVSENARNKLITLEDMTEEELERLKNSFSRAAGKTPDTALPREAADEPRQMRLRTRKRR
jgi:low affinity Fe/Cu permease